MEDIDAALLNRVQETIAVSDVICFLGFSYDKDNLTKLAVPGKLNTGAIYGSAYGLSPAARAQSQARFPKTIQLGNADAKCLDLLTTEHVIRD